MAGWGKGRQGQVGVAHKTFVSRLRYACLLKCFPTRPRVPAPATLVCSTQGLRGEGGAPRMESAPLCAVDLPGRSRSPSRQDTILCPFLGMASSGESVGVRRDRIQTNNGKVGLGG